MGGSNTEKCGDNENKNLLINNSVEALIPFNERYQGLLKLHVHLLGEIQYRAKKGAMLFCIASGKPNVSRFSLREFDIWYIML